MAEEIRDLIEKINEEGVKAAEEKAKAIEEEARRRAEAITKRAQAQAEREIAEARERIARMEESSRAILSQAGRDLILSLRKEITAILDRVIRSHVHKALNPDELADIIKSLIKDNAGKIKGDIVISLKKEDLEKLEKSLLGSLKDELKKGITLKSSEEIQAGFTISYDQGRSYYDFTDKALAEYIAFHLRPKLSEILKE
ncbi:MAG: hypothetical protein HZC19_03525 [Candidatus Omnitrophica bacterium]|nr:hypothetical protein [Candidatus Omnitrophota bacterium]